LLAAVGTHYRRIRSPAYFFSPRTRPANSSHSNSSRAIGPTGGATTDSTPTSNAAPSTKTGRDAAADWSRRPLTRRSNGTTAGSQCAGRERRQERTDPHRGGHSDPLEDVERELHRAVP